MATKVAKNTNSEAKEARTVIADTGPHRSDLGQRIAAPLALWGLAYACYRAYYAAGGLARRHSRCRRPPFRCTLPRSRAMPPLLPTAIAS